MKIINNASITNVPGFKASGIHCGLKKKNKDLCIIYSEKKCIASGVFTTNVVKAAPIILNLKHIDSLNTQALVINSGNANACTGPKGLEDAYTMANAVAKELDLSPEEVLVGSTGVIGVPMNIDIVTAGIKTACKNLSYEGGNDAASAIMTTDTFSKSITVELELNGKTIVISGMAKGSGMIHPNMATMLGIVVSNVNISKEMLSKALKESVEDSYNMISVDGDTSTNDMTIVMTNKTAGNEFINTENDEFIKFKNALHFVNLELAKMIAVDGEGATKLIESKVKGAVSLKDAKVLSKSVITSSLVKSAMFGNDANWGRIICALGYSGCEFDPSKVSIAFESEFGYIDVFKNGLPIAFDEELALKILNTKHINVLVDFNIGEFSATAYGCDLTYDYVKINGSYRS